jgi:transposase
MNLTDEQWSIIEPDLPKAPPHVCRGRPQACCRDVLDGIFWVMRTGCPWRSLPRGYPSRHVCARRYREWRQSVLPQVLSALAQDLEYRTGIIAESASLSVPRTGRERSSWCWQTVLLLRSPDAVALLGEQQRTAV